MFILLLMAYEIRQYNVYSQEGTIVSILTMSMATKMNSC